MGPKARALHTKFVERPDLTKLVESHFFPQPGGEKAFPTVSSFLLYGMAGSGKSQLAYSFFIKYAEKFWVNASSEESVEQDFQRIAKNAEPEHGAIDTVVDWLANQKLPWLLVLDNAHFKLDVRRYFPGEGCGSVLMTAQWRSEETSMAEEVKGFSQVQGLEFMKRITGRDEIKLSERAVVLDLIEKLDRIPLAIDIAGTYIRKKMISFQSYLDSNIWKDQRLSRVQKERRQHWVQPTRSLKRSR
ncbi:hypothetical protein XPA_007753 [Xanthoria parietina]